MHLNKRTKKVSFASDTNTLLSQLQLFPEQLTFFQIKNPHSNKSGDSSLLHTNFIKPLSVRDKDRLMYEVVDYLKNKKNGFVYSFFTKQIAKDANADSWQLCCCRLNKDKDEKPAEVVIFTYNLDIVKDIKKRLYSVLENETFFKENLNKVAMLTKREKEIISFLSQGMSSKQIAVLSFTSVHTINTHRQHIIKKLGIQNFPALLKFADVFDLTCNKINV